MQGPETRLRKKIVAGLKADWPKAYIRKIHGNAFQNIGIADLLCSFSGIFIALEIKTPGKRATPAQLLEGQKVVESGGYFSVVDSLDKSRSFVRECLKREKIVTSDEQQ